MSLVCPAAWLVSRFFWVTADVNLGPGQPGVSGSAAGGEACRHILLQHTGQLAKAWLALEMMWEPEHDSVSLLLRNGGGTEGGSGVQVFHLGTVRMGVMAKAPKSLGHFAYLLQCDAILRMSISLSSFCFFCIWACKDSVVYGFSSVLKARESLSKPVS